jgi:hypothetical protein
MTSAVKWTREFAAGIVAGSGIGIGLTWWILEGKLGMNTMELSILGTLLMIVGAVLARRAQSSTATQSLDTSRRRSRVMDSVSGDSDDGIGATRNLRPRSQQ